MNFLEAITELQKPENIKTKCIRPARWDDCCDHYILEDFGFGLAMSYRSGGYDPYESNPFYIPYNVDVLTGEWQICDIPALPEYMDGDE